MSLDNHQIEYGRIIEKGFSNYKELTRSERVVFNLGHMLYDGLWDHYVNSGGDHHKDAISDLEFLGFAEIVMAMKDFNKKLFPEGVPEEQMKRDEVISNLPNSVETEQLVDNLDKVFWPYVDILEAKLEELILIKTNPNTI